MLSNYPISVILLATDLTASRDFYAQKIGLEILREDERGVEFKCGDGGSRLVVSKSTIGTADEQTQATWKVEDLAAEVAELQSRGVEIVEYDTPGLKTENGIADIGFAWAAWFVDPGKNAVSMLQYK